MHTHFKYSALALLLALTQPLSAQVCGDANGNGVIENGDRLAYEEFLFGRDLGVGTFDSANADIDGFAGITVSDLATYYNTFLYGTGAVICPSLAPFAITPCSDCAPLRIEVVVDIAEHVNRVSVALDLDSVSGIQSSLATGFNLWFHDNTDQFEVVESNNLGQTERVGIDTFRTVGVSERFFYLSFERVAPGPAEIALTLLPEVDGDSSYLAKDGLIYFPDTTSSEAPWSLACCRGFVGDVNTDGGTGLPDLSFLIDHLFITFTPLPCPGKADWNRDGIISISDLALAIGDLFSGSSLIVSCIYEDFQY